MNFNELNYLTEIKAFYDTLVINSLSSPDIALWYALMSIANKSGWKNEFPVALSVLAIYSGVNESTVKRSRNKLAQCGYITWRPRRGNQAAIYHINSLVVHREPQIEPQTVPQSIPIHKTKLNKTKTNNPPISPAVHFDEFWDAYPKKGNRSLTEKAYVDVLLSNVPEEDVLAAVRNYAEAVRIQDTQERYVKNPDRFLTDNTFLDYLPGKYKKPKKPEEAGNKNNRFNKYSQRDYDYEELEKRLLGK